MKITILVFETEMPIRFNNALTHIPRIGEEIVIHTRHDLDRFEISIYVQLWV
jgi:hypothetical protein